MAEMLDEVPGHSVRLPRAVHPGEGRDATDLLGFAARQEWMAAPPARTASVARLDDTVPAEPETDDLRETLSELYAASRARDMLLLAHQPVPADDSVRDLDQASSNSA